MLWNIIPKFGYRLQYPYATIFVHETKEGTISNADGDFKLQLNYGTYHLTIRSRGYIQKEKTIDLTSDSIVASVTLAISGKCETVN
jgi:hypothetical protein